MGIKGETRAVTISLDGGHLPGDLVVPEGATGLVVFAHGSGSSRFSKRNRYVAGTLNERGLATLLFDLLTDKEGRIDQQTAELRFDIGLLTDRVVRTLDWIADQEDLSRLSLGLFGASTGAAAALSAAAQRPEAVAAVVSRGGRPDLAEAWLPKVAAPVLLVVGGEDYPVIEMNRSAQRLLPGVVELEIVPGATHLFEEPGKLEQVARLAGDWFVRYLAVEG